MWYRLRFDPKVDRENFKNKSEFTEWCAQHFSDFPYEHAGFNVVPWHESVNTMGAKLWTIIVPYNNIHIGSEPELIGFLANHHWCIDGFDVLLYIKYAMGEDEILYPIRGGHHE